MLKSTTLLFFLIFSTSAFSEKCRVEFLENLEYRDIECQFYMGTAAYRNEVYSVAAAHWNFANESEAKYEADAAIQAMALSTVTFLYYHGMGVPQDRQKAVENWEKAAAQGDFEARRHLGFAYSDDEYINKDLVKALGWYESLFLIAENPSELEESDQNVYNDALSDMEALRLNMSQKQKSQAIAFAKTTL